MSWKVYGPVDEAAGYLSEQDMSGVVFAFREDGTGRLRVEAQCGTAPSEVLRRARAAIDDAIGQMEEREAHATREVDRMLRAALGRGTGGEHDN